MTKPVTGAVNVITPCLGICRINSLSQLCEGCHRSTAEVAEWLFYSNEEKLAIIDQLGIRDPFSAPASIKEPSNSE